MRVIECICSDDPLHRRRLAGRNRGLALPEPSWDNVQRRRLEWAPWREACLRLDAVEPLERNARAAVAWVSEDGRAARARARGQG